MRSRSKFHSSSSNSSVENSQLGISHLSGQLSDQQLEEQLSESLSQSLNSESPPEKIRWQGDLKRSKSKKKQKKYSLDMPKSKLSRKQRQSIRRYTDIKQATQQHLKAKKLAQSKFYWPFDKYQLNTNREQLAKALKQASGKQNPKETKLIGIKKQKILYKWKVSEQFRWAIQFLEEGIIPECLKIQFESLLNGNNNGNQV